MNSQSPFQPRRHAVREFLVMLVVLGLILAVLFARSFVPRLALFANDGPLGVLHSASLAMPGVLTGYWMDLHWIGANGGTASLSLTYLLLWALGPLGFAKFYGPLTLLILGACAWVFFRTLGLKPALSTVGAIATALNMNYFSNTCWGLGTRSLAFAAVLLALAALNARGFGNRWLKAALAGCAVGLGVIEGADNGAIFSLYVGAFVLFQAWALESSWRNRLRSAARLVVVSACAAVVAAQVLINLVGVGIKGVAGMQQDALTKQQRWDWATQWSLPKIETLRVLIPGLYGYRMDTAGGGQYWGRVGQDPNYQPGRPGFARYSGSGEYAGVLVVLIAGWAVAQSVRRGTKAFTPEERRLIWFWTGGAVVSLLFAWGRHAPFYRLIYALPYFSTIRNPIKFMHPFHMAVLILMGYGLLGLGRLYLEGTAQKASAAVGTLRGWWRRVRGSDRAWAYGCLTLVGLSVVGYLVYASERPRLVNYLMQVGFPDAVLAHQTADFSFREVGLFVVFLGLSVAALFMVLSGVLAGRSARWAPVLLGGLIALDLARANLPWIVYYDYRQKYASNPIIDILREKPYTHRSVMPPFGAGSEFALLQQVFQIEWLQHHYPYYNIQSINVSQEPRLPADKEAYLRAVGTSPDRTRYWQLTNTRYVFGMAGGFVDALNAQLDPGRNRFRVHTLFRLVPIEGTPYFTAETNTTGPYALIEFTGALPRAKLYERWEVSTNDQTTLARLADPAFDPETTVLVSDAELPPSSRASQPGQSSVEVLSYAPKEIHLRTRASAPTVLLLNDRYDPAWRVWVDGQPAQLLRCNFIMRGVALPAGEHTVRFRFEPPLTGFWITLVAMGLGVALCGLLVGLELRQRRLTPAGASQTTP